MSDSIADSNADGSPSLTDEGSATRGERLHRAIARRLTLLIVLTMLAAGAGWAHAYDFTAEHPALVAWQSAVFLSRVFSFHAALLLAGCALAGVLLRRWTLSSATIALSLLVAWPNRKDYMPKSPPPIVGAPIRVLSSNLLGSNRELPALYDELAEADADLIALIEYRQAHHELAMARFADSHPHSFHRMRSDNFGIALFSRLAFVEPPSEFELGRAATPQIRVVVEHEGRPIVVYVVHVWPPGKHESMRELDTGFLELTRRLADETHPIVLCADLNVTPETPHYAALVSHGMRSTHDLAGFGRGATWRNIGWTRRLPGIRIDHIMLSRDLTAVSHRVGVGRGSDHRPIFSKIGFR